MLGKYTRLFRILLAFGALCSSSFSASAVTIQPELNGLKLVAPTELSIWRVGDKAFVKWMGNPDGPEVEYDVAIDRADSLMKLGLP